MWRCWQHCFAATRPTAATLKFTASSLRLWERAGACASAVALGTPHTSHGAGGRGQGEPWPRVPTVPSPLAVVWGQGGFAVGWPIPARFSPRPRPETHHSQGSRSRQRASAVPHLLFVLGEDQELWTSPGLRHIPGESPRTQTLLSGAVGAAGVMLQPRLSRRRHRSREKNSGDVSVTGAVARSPVLCPWRRRQTWSSLLRRRGLQCSVPPAPASCCLSHLGRAETPVIRVSVPQTVGR